MDGIKFYKEKNKLSVFAAFVANGTFFSFGERMIEGLGSVFDQPNSPVAGTSASMKWIEKECVEVDEATARQVHPALFQRLDNH